MADARQTESGSGRSLVSLSLQLIRIWALSFQSQTCNRAPGARPLREAAFAGTTRLDDGADRPRSPASALLRQISTCLPYYLRHYSSLCLLPGRAWDETSLIATWRICREPSLGYESVQCCQRPAEFVENFQWPGDTSFR